MANEVKLKLSMEGGKVVAAEIDGVSKNLSEMDHQANLAAVGMKALTTATGGLTVAMALGKLVSVQREFDVLNSSLITVTGSSTAAAREMAWIKGFAKETPFGLAQATQGFVKMKALGLDPTRASLTSFGNTASAMGKDLNQMIEAVADASTGEFERLKEFGIKAKQSGDQVSLTFQGVTTTIGNSSNEITAYLEALGNNQFSGAMAERAKTLDGAIAGLGDTWDELFRTVNTNNAGGFIYDSVIVATKAIEDAITVMDAMSGAAITNAKETGAMATVQEAMAVVFETVSVLGAEVKYVLVGIGNEIGGMAAQAVQILQGNFAGAAAIRSAMVADSIAARAEIDATTARVLSARKDATAAAEVNATANARLARQGIENDERAISSAGKSSATKQKLTAEQKLANDGMALYNDLLDIGSGYTATYAEDQRKLAAAFKSGLIPSYAQYTAAVEILMARQPRMIAATKAEEAARKGLNEAIQGGLQAQKKATEEDVKYLKVRQELLQVAQDGADSLQFEISLMGLSAAGRQQAIEQYRIMAELKKRLADIDANAYYQANPEARAAAIADAQIAAATRAATASGRVTLDAWNKTYDEISTGLTDAIMSAGKDGGKGLRDFLEAELLTKPFKMVVQAMIQPLAQGLTNLVMGQGGAGGGMLGLLSNAGGLGSLANMASVGYAGGVGAGVSALFGTTAGNAAIGTALTGSASMSAAAATAAAEAAGASAAAAGSAASLGAAAAAAVPWVAGALAIGSLLFADHGTPTQSTGDGGASFDASGKLTGVSQSFSGINGNVTSVLAGLQQSYAKTAGDLGIGTVATNFAYGGNTGKDSASPNFALGVSAGGRSYNTGETPLNDSALQLAASRAVLTALQGSELPDYLEGAFDGLTPSTMTQDQINQTLTSAKSVKSFHEAVQDLPFDSVKNLSYGATIALGEASGGLGTLQQSLTNMATASTAAKAGINALVSGIKDSVHTTLWDMQYGMADNKGKYGMLDVRGATLDQQMRSATDINDVAKYGNLEIANIKQSWGLLSAEQQAASYAQYEKILTGIEDYMTEKGADALALQQVKDDKTAKTIADSVKLAVADAMTKPGQQITDAAALLNVAADKPAVANISVNVSAPVGVEVSLSGDHR